MAKPYCNAIGCRNIRTRPNSSHCPAHEAEWHAIQREQKYGLTMDLRRRPIAMGMREFRRS
jgi:hypothetical protein